MSRPGGISVHNFDNLVMIAIEDKSVKANLNISLSVEDAKKFMELLAEKIKIAEKC